MLIYHRTGLFESRAQTLVNPVNTVGVMGAGLAHEFKIRHPQMFKRYRELCKLNQFSVGQLWLWKNSDQWVLNFPTKKHWRQPSKLEYIELGLRKLASTYEQKGIREIAFPRLGCGHGGLDWDEVRPLMEAHLKRLPITVYIHDYSVELPVPEHFSLDEIDPNRDFVTFLSDISSTIESCNGSFTTLLKNSPFTVAVNDEGLIISTKSKNNTVFKDDLFDLWTVLQRSPVTNARMVGSARSYGHYLLAVLSKLPYLRIVKTATDAGDGSLALEKRKSMFEVKGVSKNASHASTP